MCWKSLNIHPIMIKSTQCFFFFNSYFKIPFSNQAVLRSLSELCSSAQAPPTIVDWQDRLTLDPPWVSWEMYDSGAGKTRTSLIERLRCFVVGCNNEYSGHHLLPTSKPLKTRRINVTLVFEVNASIPDLSKCVFVCANHSWFTLTYRRSEYKGFLWIFANRLS